MVTLYPKFWEQTGAWAQEVFCLRTLFWCSVYVHLQVSLQCTYTTQVWYAEGTMLRTLVSAINKFMWLMLLHKIVKNMCWHFRSGMFKSTPHCTTLFWNSQANTVNESIRFWVILGLPVQNCFLGCFYVSYKISASSEFGAFVCAR